MDIGHIKFIAPEHPKIKKWIKGYYVHSSESPNFHSKVTFYQNITTTISIYKNSKTSSKDRFRKQHFKKDNGFTTLLVGLVDKYQEVEFFGPLDRLAIVFYPGGLNQFMRNPLGEYLNLHYSNFDYFNEGFESFLPKVFRETSLLEKRTLLDNFFLDYFQLLHEPQLLKAIDLLFKTDKPIKVQALAKSLDLSRRTLLRKFKTHLGYSVEEYKKVIKFRKALLHFQQNRKIEKLSHIALDSYYYDQPDFNRHIKTQSELTPGALFQQLEIVDNTLFWKL